MPVPINLNPTRFSGLQIPGPGPVPRVEPEPATVTRRFPERLDSGSDTGSPSSRGRVTSVTRVREYPPAG
eukprot:14220-Rhodomonas_salina.1